MKLSEPQFRERMTEALRLHRKGERPAAIALYQELRRIQPAFPPLLNLLGLALTQEGRVLEGLPLLTEAVRLAPDYPDGWLNLAYGRQQAKDLAGARTAYQILLQLQPENLTALLSFASLLAEESAPEAVALLRRAVALAPNRALPWLRLRKIAAYYGDRAGVAEADRHIAASRLESPEEMAEGAAAHVDRGDYQTAADLYRRALEQRPDMALAALHLGMALSYVGDQAGACEAFRRAAQLAPRQAAPWIGLGWAEAATGAREAAAAAFREALKREGDDSFAQHLLNAAEGNTTALAPPAFVARIFDELAAIYESLLARDGDLRAQPQLARQLLRLQPGRLFASMLDISCGTGALARALAATTRRRSGLDLSRRMLDWAKLTRLYDDVIEQPPIEYLAGTQQRYELITAAEMLPYIGDLAPLFDELRSHLQPGGVFAATVDRLKQDESGNYLLRVNGRFAHAEGYVSALAAERGLTVLHLERVDLRRGRGEMTPCVVVLFQQPG